MKHILDLAKHIWRSEFHLTQYYKLTYILRSFNVVTRTAKFIVDSVRFQLLENLAATRTHSKLTETPYRSACLVHYFSSQSYVINRLSKDVLP
jgi:hypothetical protein